MSKKSRLVIISLSLLVIVATGLLLILAKTGKLALLADVIRPKTVGELGNIAIQVRDPNHQKLSYEVAVNATRLSDNYHLPPQNTPNGDTAFNNLQLGNYQFYAQKDQTCQSAMYPKTIVAGQNPNLEIALNCSQTMDMFSVSGRVTKTDNSNLSGVGLTLSAGSGFYKTAETNSEGKYQIDNIPITSGLYGIDYKIKFEKADYQTQTKNFNQLGIPTGGWPLVGGSNYTAATIALAQNQTTTTLDFLIQDQDKKPLANISIIRDSTEEKTSNPSGSGQFKNIVFGNHQFLINGEGAANYNLNYQKNVSAEYQVAAEKDNQLIVTLYRGNDKLTVAGKVIDKETNRTLGSPTENINIIIAPLNGGIAESTNVKNQLFWPENSLIYNYSKVNFPYETSKTYFVKVELPPDSIYKEPARQEIKLNQEVKYDNNYNSYFAEVNFSLERNNNTYTIIIKDNKTKTPIAGAQIKILARSENRELNAMSNSLGKAYFYQYDIIQFHYFSDPEARISANGYVTKLILGSRIDDFNISDFDPWDIFANVPWTVFLNPKTASGTKISGLVKYKDQDRYLPVASAKISLWKDNPNNNPLQTTSANNDGFFELSNISPGSYYINTFHIDYLDTPRARAYIANLKSNESIEVVLFLQKYQQQLTINYPIIVLQSKSLKPLNNIKVTITHKGGQIEKNTSGDGRADFMLDLNQTITAKVEFRKQPNLPLETKEKQIKLPANFDDLNQQEIYQLFAYGIFIIPSESPDQNNLANLTIVAKNKRGQPISDLLVYISPNYTKWDSAIELTEEADFNLLPDVLYGVTSDLGKLIIPAGLSESLRYGVSSENLQDSLIKNLRFYLGDELKIDVYDATNKYDEVSKNLTITSKNQIFEIVLDEKNNSLGELTVNFIDYFGNTNWNAIISSNQPVFIIQKKQPDRSYQDLDLKPRSIENKKKNEEDSPKNAIIVASFTNLDSGNYRIFMPKVNYYSGSFDFDAKKDKKISISYCPENDLIKHFDNNIYYVFQNQEIKNWFNTNINFFIQLNQQIGKMKNQSSDIGRLVIFLKSGISNARADKYNPNCFQENQPVRIITYYKELLDWQIRYHRYDKIMATVAHEYGHLLYQKNFIDANNLFYKKWSGLFDWLKTQSFRQCVWDKIKDANVAVLPNSASGHPSDNDQEMFASFFSAYFSYHDRFHGIIRYHCQENSYCQNVLAYMWELFSENVGTVYGNDDLMFKPVGGKIGNANYSFEQIKRGQWMESNYNTLKFPQKVMIQFNRIIGPVANVFRWEEVQEKINAFNNWLDEQLRKLGLWNNTGTVTGTLKDQNGAVVLNTMIQIGPRVVKTRANGAFTALRVPEGSQDIIRVQFKNSTYPIASPQDKKIIVPKGGTINVEIVARR